MNFKLLVTFAGSLSKLLICTFYPILFSGRGYWQELIESIVWAHNKLKVAPSIQPRALSITQGRAVGVAHYLLGGIATTWSFFLARIILVG
jgi:photosystem I P700 chlorophyll a apoprotein A1